MGERQGKCQYFTGMIVVLFVFGAMYAVMCSGKEGLAGGRAYEVADESYGAE